MSKHQAKKFTGKSNLITAAIVASLGYTSMAGAQGMRLEEIVVTAQKRVQSVQDIPVAVTALTENMIEVNNVVDVNDLSGLAPNLTVRPAAGGSSIPAFNMRGITSYGVVAGSDKQISVYLDGVYLGSPRGGIFKLPDIQQLEVLRGPQGTLFGRNATGGAISIRTRDPAGELQFRQKVTVGNRDLLGTETTIDFPKVGPFSAYLTYFQEEADGDVKNLGAGTRWDRTGFGGAFDTSPKTLGALDNDSIFLSTYFDFDDITVSYKYDYGKDEGTPSATAIVTGFDLGVLGPQFGALFDLIAGFNPDFQSEGTTRPSAVNNAFSLARDMEVQGHTVYLEWALADELTLKNTLGYRETELFVASDLTGTSGWGIPGFLAPLLSALAGGNTVSEGDLFCYACTQPTNFSEQWSNELQLDYDSDFVTVISGLLYYDSEDESGSPRNSINTFTLSNQSIFPGNIIPRAGQGLSFNEAKSYSVYSQAEFHLTDQLDLMAGVRYTKDEKSGEFLTGLPEDPVDLDKLAASPGSYYSNGDGGGYFIRSFDFEDEHVDYLLGVNYALSDSIMTYAKFSTAFVSGGSVAGFDFDPEEVESWEIGAKMDFLDSRLRTNIAVFDAEYTDLQTAQSGANIEGANGIGVLVVQGGTLDAEGVELEVYALPTEGLTVSATLGYVNAEFSDVNPVVAASVGAQPVSEGGFPGSSFEQTLAPEWNGNLSISYQTEPLFNTAYISAGVTGIWRDKIRMDSNPGRAANSPAGAAEFSPETWIVNARLALKDITLSDNWSGEVGLWGRNITDDDSLRFITNFGAFPGGDFQEARSYGIDFVVNYQ